jgi:diaminopimelate decarboxylase
MGQGVLTEAFQRRDGVLFCEETPLLAVVETVGTPAYVYSAGAVRQQYERLDAVLADVPHRIHYSLKANACLALLGVLRASGAGADVVSGGELHRALLAGFRGPDIIFGGVGKTEHELVEALRAGVLLINVESEGELRALDRLARERRMRAPIALRVNPEISAETFHAYTSTGGRGHKFGIPYDDAPDVAKLALSLDGVELAGLDMHVGSQLSRLDAYEHGVGRMLDLHEVVQNAGASSLRFFDIGGGLAVPYDAEVPPDLDRYASIAIPAARRTGLTLLVEPGRFLVAAAGVLLTRVLYRKRSGGRELVITDAGMTELLRPSHYQAFHRIESLAASGDREAMKTDVVGPVCESGDFLALDRELEDVRPGDVLAVHTAGAYGFSMASNYNSRPKPAEVMVDGARYAVATRRETYSDLVRNENTDLDWRDACSSD